MALAGEARAAKVRAVIPPFDVAILAVVLVPFLAGAFAPLLQRAIGWWAGIVLALLPAAICWYLATLIPEVAAGGALRADFTWIPAYAISLSLVVDSLSLTFALLISGIGTLILIYSAAYLRGHRHQGRFMAVMVMFLGAMLGLVLAAGVIPLYIFWELTTVTSFLLIGFDHARQEARRAAFQALVVTNIGGLALLTGGIALRLTSGSWDLSAAGPGDGFLLLMVMLAAFTKSAQVPFHFWLPGAMQAPTPVSAFLHSAAMVQAGVYLLLRMEPAFGGLPVWTWTLALLGGATLFWGGLMALKQTDLKQMLAQTTIASLGLLVLLVGIGATEAALVYFVAHALYKAALFLVAGVIENETGTRDLTTLSGLRDRMAATFLTSIAASASMAGIPPALGFFGKEEAYAAVGASPFLLLVLIAANALLIGVALTVAFRPFMGPLHPTPQEPHDGELTLLFGPVLLGVLGLAAPWLIGWLGVEAHLAFDPLSLTFWLSVLTWGLGAAVFWRLDTIRVVLGRAGATVGFTFDRGFDAVMFGLVRFAGNATRVFHHGRLELYLVVVFAMLALAIGVPLIGGGLPQHIETPSLTFYEWGVVAMAAAGVVTVLLARTRLFAIVALGVQGLGVALLYLLFGAPDLSFTQFMIEILSVVILALVMTRLKLDREDRREFEDLLRDGTVALLCGGAIVALLLTMLDGPFDPRLSDFFAANSAAVAHGHNIVNVILVDFRGLDTLGEISVIMIAGIAILALVRHEPKRMPVQPVSRRRRKTEVSS